MEHYLAQAKQLLPWLVTIRAPDTIWDHHPSFLIAEIFFYFIGILTLSHALRHGGRYPYLWMSIFLQGAIWESLSAFLPQLHIFWHAQASIMLFGSKVPLYILFFYHAIMYTAMVTAAKLRLGSCAEAFAAGIFSVILEYPLEILGPKLLWWSLHDTDPYMAERHLNAPWINYMFQTMSVSSLVLVFHGIRAPLAKHQIRFESAGVLIETLSAVLTPVLGGVLLLLKMCVFYHVLHEKLHLHTEICALVVFSIYAMITWSADRNPANSARNNKGDWLDEVGFAVFLQCSFCILLVSFAQPERIRSVGYHEPIGPCTDSVPVHSPLGGIFSRQKYLCVEKYSEPYYDWHCVEKPPAFGATWYTICGTPFRNYEDYLVTVMLSCCLGFYVFWQVLGYSGNYPKTIHQHIRQHQHHHKQSKLE